MEALSLGSMAPISGSGHVLDGPAIMAFCFPSHLKCMGMYVSARFIIVSIPRGLDMSSVDPQTMPCVFIGAYIMTPMLVILDGHNDDWSPSLMFSTSDSPIRRSISFPQLRTLDLSLPITNRIMNADLVLSYIIGMLCRAPSVVVLISSHFPLLFVLLRSIIEKL